MKDKITFWDLSQTSVVGYAWDWTKRDAAKESLYNVASRDAYFEQLCKAVKNAVLGKLKELAIKRYSKFNEFKTFLDPEILSEALEAGVRYVDSEIAKLPTEPGNLVYIDPEFKEEAVRIEQAMLEVVEQLEQGPDRNWKMILDKKARRLEQREAEVRKLTMQNLLELYKAKLIEVFRHYYDIELKKEREAEVNREINPKNRK